MGNGGSVRSIPVISCKASDWARQSAQPAICDSAKAARSGSSSPSAASASSSIDKCAQSWNESSGLQPGHGLFRALVKRCLRCTSQYPGEEGRMTAAQQRHGSDDLASAAIGPAYG